MKRVRLTLTCLTLVVSLTLVFTTTAHVQSGRIKEKNPQRPASGSAQDATRTTPGKSRSNTQSQPQKPKMSDELDEADIVRVTSNLVPIPASVVDVGGNAITGLRLEDFELRVDGHVRPISDMTRAETSVKLVMLFDNSGSVFLSREFEKQAAKRFFRKVMRPSDEAAIYSIESDSYLAQPLT
jgi:hypothetical protein